MYFITSGKINIFQSQTNSSFKKLTPGTFFGELSFFTGQKRCASAGCLDFVDLLSLSRDNFLYLLEKFPEAKETTNFVMKKVDKGDISQLNVRCYLCKKRDHVATQ
jgi:CRP-like cAMP-binding protein